MRIALDARYLYCSDRRGIGKTLLDLYRHVLKLRPDWEVMAYHRSDQEPQDLLPTANFRPQSIGVIGDRGDAWERWRLPLAAWQDGCEVLHCPANTCPTWMPIPTLVTIHDLIPLEIPQGNSSFFMTRFEQAVRTACKRAWIMCPSQYTASRVIEAFGADPNRITVNHWAANTSVEQVPAGEGQAVLDKYDITADRFVLHFGSGEVRKNTRRLIEAWSLLSKRLREQWRLLVVGLQGAGKPRAAQWVSQSDLHTSVRLGGFADEQDLPTLLSAASVLAYPSLSEGFGLPILDAWAAGTAVLCGNATCLPEIASQAAVLVDPTSASAIAEGLEQLLQNEMMRIDWARLGRERLVHYSWHASAERFIDTIQRASGFQHYRAAA